MSDLNKVTYEIIIRLANGNSVSQTKTFKTRETYSTIESYYDQAVKYAENIGKNGLWEDIQTYYPPHRIDKIVINEIDD